MRIVKHIPNTITSLNLLSGAFSIIFAFQGDFATAFLCMVFASLFDFCDGFAARLLHAYSDIGKELDSLSDMVSFGLAPSIILFTYMKGIDGIAPFVCYVPLLIAVFSALRLAKFNLDTRQTASFLGLPTPACALFLGSLIAFVRTPSGEWLGNLIGNNYVLPILSLLLSVLLVCGLPMFSMKVKSLKWNDNRLLFIFIICTIPIAVFCAIFHIHWTGIVFFVFLLYILWNLLRKLLK